MGLGSWRASLLLQLGLLEACGASGADDPAQLTQDQSNEPASSDSSDGDVLGLCAELETVELENGATSGLLACEGSQVAYRAGASSCHNQLPEFPGSFLEPGDPLLHCTSNADCSAGPRGYCEQDVLAQVAATSCHYACETDADCAAGTVCDCGPQVGRCVPATCSSSADCGGEPCLRFRDTSLCGDGYIGESFYGYYACLAPDDECVNDSDCAEGQACSPTEFPLFEYESQQTNRRCQQVQLCGIGRPFLIAAEARLAPSVSRHDWCAEPGAIALPSAERCRMLSERWAVIGAMEHASVAAFARFTLQLLAVGAPAELVDRSSRAMADETRHARVAFGLASRYAGAPLGPGPLPIDGALEETTLEAIAESVFLEGCIGETRAAIEASWASQQTLDPALRRITAEIAADERAHAELAWTFVQWAIEHDSSIGERLRRLLQSIEPTSSPATSDDDAWTSEHGLVPSAQRTALHAMARTEIVEPCLRALMARVTTRSIPMATANSDARVHEAEL